LPYLISNDLWKPLPPTGEIEDVPGLPAAPVVAFDMGLASVSDLRVEPDFGGHSHASRRLPLSKIVPVTIKGRHLAAKQWRNPSPWCTNQEL
jgi:hypothetical protein